MSVAIAQGELRQSNKFERMVRRPTFWLLFWVIGFSYPLVRSVNRDLPEPLPVYYQLPQYELVNEFNKPFGSNDLEGKVYIASFAFTSCPTVCPGLIKKLQKIHKRIRGLRGAVTMVTYTVDPKTDTPKVLFNYARKLQTNPQLWTFLTGQEGDVKNLLVDGFKVPKGDREYAKNVYDIAHSQKLVLVDRKGQIRGYYSTDKDSINKLMIDTGLLANNSFKSKE